MTRKLYKINEGKVIDGVCAGIGDYFGLDPVLVRLVWILFSAMGGSGIVAYIVCALIIPRDPSGR